MITKMETSACVATNIYIELTYENLQESKCKFNATSLMGIGVHLGRAWWAGPKHGKKSTAQARHEIF